MFCLKPLIGGAMTELEKLHSVHLEIADELHRVCVENDIEYFLAAGTFLGAIRHKGFIPWDDDFDAGMTRENFEKFIKIVKDKISDNFYYISTNTNDKYALPFIKIMKKHTQLRESSAPLDLNEYGIFIDVFIFDSVPESKLAQFHHNVSTQICKKLLLAKNNYRLDLNSRPIKRIVYKGLSLITKVIPKELIAKSMHKNISRYQDEQSDFLTNVGEYYSNYNSEMISRKDISNLKLYDFEEHQYYGFVEYDRYLKGLYGDYMQFPPLAEQTGQHNYESVNFDTKKQ